MIYADADFYAGEFGGDKELTAKDLTQASRHIDTLTFNRIGSLDDLTPFQQRVVKECCCMMAEFEHDNADLIDSAISSYSLNGASVSLGDGLNVKAVDGVVVRADIYAYLQQTGLCNRSIT